MKKIINLLRHKFHSKRLKKKCKSKDGVRFFLNSHISNQSNDIEKISLSVKPENLNAIKSYSKNGWVIGEKTKTSLQMHKLI